MTTQPQPSQPEPQNENDTNSYNVISPKPAHAQDKNHLRKWRERVEELLAEARDRGEFDNLPGAGQPLNLEKNVYAGDKELAYGLLKNNHLAPPEIERGKEIDGEIARAEALLTTLRRRRDALHVRRMGAFASERRAYNLLRDKIETRYAEALRGINSKILSLNIIAPPALHRRTLDVNGRLAAFRSEFPRLEE